MNCAVLQKLLCEFVGTFGLTFTVVMTQTGTSTVFAASAFLACFAYAFGSISGTHINPAVSISVFTWGLIEGTAKAIELPLYVLSQFIGNFHFKTYMKLSFLFRRNYFPQIRFLFSMRCSSRWHYRSCFLEN